MILKTHWDLDGVACAILAGIIYEKSEINMNFTSPNKLDEDINKLLDDETFDDEILITDLSISKETAERLNKYNRKSKKINKVLLIDHHRNLEWLNEYDWAYVKTESDNRMTCATELLYKMHKKELDEYSSAIENFVEAVRRWDTWEWKTKYNKYYYSRALNKLLEVYGIADFINLIQNNIMYCNAILTDEDYRILEGHFKVFSNYVNIKDKQIMTTKINSYNVGLLFAENNISELGNELLDRHPELDYMALITPTSVCLRTNKDDIDLSLIAKEKGGGGHKKAAGYPIKKEYIEKYLSNIL